MKFTYKAKLVNTQLFKVIEIEAELYNGNSDTVIFLTSSCFGFNHLLQFDTTKFSIVKMMDCYADVPQVERIIPKGYYYFKTWLEPKRVEMRVKLGFLFLEFNQINDIANISTSDIIKYSRYPHHDFIVWSDEEPVL